MLIACTLLALLFAAILAGMEVALLSVSELKLEIRQKQQDPVAKRIAMLLRPHTLARVLIALQIGRWGVTLCWISGLSAILTRAGVAFGWDVAENPLVFLLSMLVLAVAIGLPLGDFLPRTLFKQAADVIVFNSSGLLKAYYRLFQGPAWFIEKISHYLLRHVLRVPSETTPPNDRQEARWNIHRAEVHNTTEESGMPEREAEMISNALSFRDTRARNVMIPRTEIEAVQIEIPMQNLMERFVETRLSRIVVYGENLDDIRGYVHSTRMFERPEHIEDILQEVLMAPETMPAHVLLSAFNTNKKSVAIVVDEYGGTSGLITIEDLVEEVFGDIEDEYDQQQPGDEPEDLQLHVLPDEQGYLLGARLEITELNERLSLELPEEEHYHTLGGLFTYIAEDIPHQGQEISVGPYRLIAEKTTLNRVLLIRLLVTGQEP